MTDLIELYGLSELKIRGGHEWFRFADHDVRTDSVDVELYDEIGAWGITAADFTAQLDALPKSTKTINLRVNSPGGGVFAGLAIANRLRDHKATVNVTVDGVAASIASVIAMAGDTVTMNRGATMMIHNPSGIVMGDAPEMRKMADTLDKLALDSIANAYAGRAGAAGGSAQDWLDRMAAETWYSGPEAVALGLADSSVGDESTEEDNGDGDQVAAVVPFDITAYGFRHSSRADAPDPLAVDRHKRSQAIVARVRNLSGRSSK